MGVLMVLAQEEKLQVTVTESLKGGVVTGVATTVGGLLGGPPGFLIGAGLGSVAAYFSSSGKFQSVAEILSNMDAENKGILFSESLKIFKTLSIQDLADLQKALGDSEPRMQLIKMIVDHVEGKLHMEITH